MNAILKDKKVIFSIVCFIIIGLLPIAFKGIQYGMDFKGGTIIQVNINAEKDEAVDTQTLITVLQDRINAYGLKDVSIKAWGDPVSYIIVEVAETDPEAVNQIQSILGQQGKFETLFNGEVVLKGEDVVSVFKDPQKGYGMRTTQTGYEWVVPFLLSSEGSSSFAESVKGKCTPLANSESCAEQVYMYIDRPENALILIPSPTYEAEANVPDNFIDSQNTIPIQQLAENSGVTLEITNEITDEVLTKAANRTVIIPADAYDNTEALEQVAKKVITKQKTEKYWIVDALNIENIVHLTPGVTAGTPVTQPSITGFSQTPEEAQKEMDRIVILLKSGKLPVSVSVGSVSTISATLGEEFLMYSMYAAIIAIIIVVLCLFVRYRKPKIVFPITMTLVFEVTMILGVSSLIGWQMDLASVAGIVAAIGTGIDDQIIIIDEVLRKEEEEERLQSIVSKIKRAFAIVFMSAGALIFAMLPLLFMGLGVLKGFAITTIIGVLVGILITRPAYASIIREIM